MKLELWADGACKGNPGPGGWAYILLAYDEERALIKESELSGHVLTPTTNNRMELWAVIMGLRGLTKPSTISVHTDSLYVINPFGKNWIDGWRRKSFAKIKNPDLWQALDFEVIQHQITWIHVPGHSGVALNERCDRLASSAASR